MVFLFYLVISALVLQVSSMRKSSKTNRLPANVAAALESARASHPPSNLDFSVSDPSGNDEICVELLAECHETVSTALHFDPRTTLGYPVAWLEPEGQSDPFGIWVVYMHQDKSFLAEVFLGPPREDDTEGKPSVVKAEILHQLSNHSLKDALLGSRLFPTKMPACLYDAVSFFKAKKQESSAGRERTRKSFFSMLTISEDSSNSSLTGRSGSSPQGQWQKFHSLGNRMNDLLAEAEPGNLKDMREIYGVETLDFDGEAAGSSLDLPSS